jgi:hypothetical protein
MGPLPVAVLDAPRRLSVLGFAGWAPGLRLKSYHPCSVFASVGSFCRASRTIFWPVS